MSAVDLVAYADVRRGRVLDLPAYLLARLADALAIDPPDDIAAAQRELRARDVEAEHYRLSADDVRGLPRRTRSVR